MSQHTLSVETTIEATKAAPPVAISIASLGGISLQDWVFIATLIYTSLLIFGWLWKFFGFGQRRGDDNEPA